MARNCLFQARFKNQRPPAEVVPAPSKGHPHTPSYSDGLRCMPLAFILA